MKEKNIKDKLVEEKEVLKGNETKDKVYSSVRSYDSIDEAREAFERAREKLFNINQWSELHALSANFQSHAPSGEEKATNLKEGDFIKITLPGPLPENWVVVTGISTEENVAEITVSPSKKPNSFDRETEHFFIKEAQSTFKVERRKRDLYAFEIGTNEGINNSGRESGNRSLINTLIAEGGWAGFQKFQWKKLTDYLVHKTELKTS